MTLCVPRMAALYALYAVGSIYIVVFFVKAAFLGGRSLEPSLLPLAFLIRFFCNEAFACHEAILVGVGLLREELSPISALVVLRSLYQVYSCVSEFNSARSCCDRVSKQHVSQARDWPTSNS